MTNGSTCDPRVVTTPCSSPRSSISLSLLGHASSLLDLSKPIHKYVGGEDEEMDLDNVVSRLYAEVREDDPANLILKEKLDGKDGLLMDGNLRSRLAT
jgi:hypothetical protein